MKTTLKSTLKALLTLTFILTLLLNGTAFAQSAFDQTAAENLALEAAGATRERSSPPRLKPSTARRPMTSNSGATALNTNTGSARPTARSSRGPGR